VLGVASGLVALAWAALSGARKVCVVGEPSTHLGWQGVKVVRWGWLGGGHLGMGWVRRRVRTGRCQGGGRAGSGGGLPDAV